MQKLRATCNPRVYEAESGILREKEPALVKQVENY